MRVFSKTLYSALCTFWMTGSIPQRRNQPGAALGQIAFLGYGHVHVPTARARREDAEVVTALRATIATALWSIWIHRAYNNAVQRDIKERS